jgi:hypothetical protein
MTAPESAGRVERGGRGVTEPECAGRVEREAGA